MARKGVVEFGNFLVTYGAGAKAKGLLDYPEFFIPALFDPNERDGIGARYIILKHELVNLAAKDEEDEWAVAFEFVKVQSLKSEQQLVDGALKAKERKIPDDAPSAIGVLVLRTHRLAYWGKTAGAPSAKQFVQSLRVRMKQLYTEHLEALREGRTREEGNAAVAAFKAATPRPSIEYVAIMGKERIAEALKGFKKVQVVSLDVLQTNPEEYAPSKRLIRQLRKLRKDAGSKVTRLQHSNPEGLDPEAVQKQLEAAADDDHTKTKMSGKNLHDNDETWNDAKLSLHVPLPGLDYSSMKRAATGLVGTMTKELSHLAARAVPVEKVKKAIEWVEQWRNSKK